MNKINCFLLKHKKILLPILTITWIIGMALWLGDIYTWWSIPIIIVTIIINVYGWSLIIIDLAKGSFT